MQKLNEINIQISALNDSVKNEPSLLQDVDFYHYYTGRMKELDSLSHANKLLF